MRHALYFAALALVLTSCGRQESVEEVRADRARAEAAQSAPAAKAADDGRIATGRHRDYTNSNHGYRITLPEGWVRNDSASNADGVTYEDPGTGADIKIYWRKNGADADLQKIVASMNAGAGEIEGNFTSAAEYRGTANDDNGNRVAIRLLKLADGSAVGATVTFPEMLSDQYAAIGQAALDSLTVTSAPQP